MASPDFMSGWLRGFFDGEGSVVFKTSAGGKRHASYYLSVVNTDLALMNTVRDYLDALGVGHSDFSQRTREGKKPCYGLHIQRAEDILLFAQEVGFGSVDKQSTLDIIVSWITRPQGYYRMDELFGLRQQGLSFREIAKLMGLKEGVHSHLAKLYNREEEIWLKSG